MNYLTAAIDVTAAIIKKDNKILIAQRAKNEKMPGKWEFPGGKVEPGETPEECLKREIKEEFSANVEVLEKYAENVYEYDTGAIRLIAFNCKWISGEFILSVHSKIEWVRSHELYKYDFAPADIPFVKMLAKDS